MNQVIASCKRDLLDIYKHALEAVKPDRLIKNCVRFDAGKFVIDDPLNPRARPLEYDLGKTRIHVVGGGKCVLAMAGGLAEVARESQTANLFSSGCLSVPVNSKHSLGKDVATLRLLSSLDISVKFGSKDNLPDKDSVYATECIFDKINEASEMDRSNGLKSLFVVLISGGGSACLTSPKHLSLPEKSLMIKSLVQRGADIAQLNMVRRCFSAVKGGNLGRYILTSNPDAKVVTLIMSDVINDPVDIIASGPTCLPSADTNFQDSMESVMKKYDIEPPRLPKGEFPPVNAGSVHNLIIGNNKLALNALSDRASDLGYSTTLLGNDLSGTTSEVLRLFVEHSKSLSGKSLLVGAGECTVSREPGESWGVGGRVQELALDYMIEKLSSESPKPDKGKVEVFMSGSTDGQDGPTDVAACFASYAEWYSKKTFDKNDLIQAKNSHDSFNFWTKHQPDWLVKTGPTGTNVMDLYMLANIKLEEDV